MKLLEILKQIWKIIIFSENIKDVIEPPVSIIKKNNIKDSKLEYPSKPQIIKEKEIKQLYKSLDDLRSYQLEAYNKTKPKLKRKHKGQFLLPTGTGKTWIQTAIHIEDMKKKSRENKCGIYVIAAHRLLLCQQLFDALVESADVLNIKYDKLFIGSGGYDDLPGTTSCCEIEAKVNEARKNKKHLIITSTYHSFNKLSDTESTEYDIDICTFDEAHNLVNNSKFKKNIVLVKPKITKQYYFTATPKKIGKSSGQLDIDFFGKVLFHMSPKEAVERKLIVPPALIIGEIINKDEIKLDENNIQIDIQTIIDSFKHQEKISKLPTKLLVSFRKVKKQLIPIYEHPLFISWCEKNNIKRFMFSSGKNGYRIDNKKYNYIEYMLPSIKEIKDDKETKCIFMHHDILSEGIDIPNMTGILMLRNLEENQLRFTQNVGRCCRLIKGDENVVLDKMQKPFSYISLPGYLANTEKYEKLIESIYKSYRIKYSDVKIFIASADGKLIEYDRSKNDSIDKFIDIKFTHEIKTFLDLFNLKSIKEELEIDFNKSKEKNPEEFLEKLLEDVYGEESIIEEQQNQLYEGKKAIAKEHEYLQRNPAIRREFLKWCENPYICKVCNKNLEDIYGKVAQYVIEVHHIKEFKNVDKKRPVKFKDLISLCPNCHTIIHMKKRPCYTIEELKEIITKQPKTIKD